MKKFFALICVYISLIFFVFDVSAQDYKTIRDGIEYAELTREIDKTPVRMNLLRLDLKKVRLDVVHALDSAIGLEKTSSIARRYGAIAAINAGFFRIDKSIYEGDDVSILMVDGKLLSESSSNRIAMGIINGNGKTEVNFGHLVSKSFAGFGIDSLISFSGINRERKNNETIIYTPDFHRTTLTDSTGTEIILSKCLRRCEKVEILKDKGSSKIPNDGYVISIGKEVADSSNEVISFARQYVKSKDFLLSLGNYASRIESADNPADTFFSKAEDIVSGVPQLIKNGKIDITWEKEKSSKSFVETKHPRTAVAKLRDGKFLMVTIDGRSESSGGIGLQNLAELLLEFGATDAMNLDGGGSTTMFLDGKIVNHPSDKEGERKVGDAILVFPRK
jgi:exopolysaccharide biosynthesis protein